MLATRYIRVLSRGSLRGETEGHPLRNESDKSVAAVAPPPLLQLNFTRTFSYWGTVVQKTYIVI